MDGLWLGGGAGVGRPCFVFGIMFLSFKDKLGVKEEMKDAIYVTMEILSNWGNLSWVGLTEVEFFDLDDTKLYVSPHDVDIRNADTPGDLGQLVNRNLAVSGGGTAARLGLALGCVFSAHDVSSLKVGCEQGTMQSPLLLIWATWEGAVAKVGGSILSPKLFPDLCSAGFSWERGRGASSALFSILQLKTVTAKHGTSEVIEVNKAVLWINKLRL